MFGRTSTAKPRRPPTNTITPLTREAARPPASRFPGGCVRQQSCDSLRSKAVQLTTHLLLHVFVFVVGPPARGHFCPGLFVENDLVVANAKVS